MQNFEHRRAGVLGPKFPFVNLGNGHQQPRSIRAVAKDEPVEVASHHFVAELAAAPFDHQGTTRLGVLVVLTNEGRRALAEQGRAQIGAEIGKLLVPFYDRVVLPRRWRYIDALPTDSRGKLTMATVSELLATLPAQTPGLSEEASSDTQSAVDLPTASPKEAIISEEILEDRLIERRLIVPDDLAYLDGHFPNFPLVPGVVQIKWVMAAADELLQGAGLQQTGLQDAGLPDTGLPDTRLQHTGLQARVKAVKFNDPLRPGDSFVMRVELDLAANRIDFALTDGPRKISSGQLTLR
jgi:3-hydroxymyristoyl/3-hydroxydecanoyl-(acyl carrier protein) dehydratase